MKCSKVSVILPAYNEEKNICTLLDKTKEVLSSTFSSWEIIVVDDGSTDRTSSLARSCGVKVISHGKNQGKGAALKLGFDKAEGDIIVTMDADCSHKPEDIIKLTRLIQGGADVVTGSRFANGNGEKSTKKLHILGNNIINALITLATGRTVTDSQTGFRAYRKQAVGAIRLKTNGYQIETELTVKTLRNGFVVKEVPIRCSPRNAGYSRLNPLTDGLKIVLTIIKASFED